MSETHIPEDNSFDDSYPVIKDLEVYIAEARKRHGERIENMSPFERGAFWFSKRIRATMVEQYDLRYKRESAGRIGKLLIPKRKLLPFNFGMRVDVFGLVDATMQTEAVPVPGKDDEPPKLYAVQLRADEDSSPYITHGANNYPKDDYCKSTIFVLDQTPDSDGVVPDDAVVYTISPETKMLCDYTSMQSAERVDNWPTDESARRLVAILRAIDFQVGN